MKPYPSNIEGMAIVHGENMENSGKCRVRQEATIEIIEALEDKYHATETN